MPKISGFTLLRNGIKFDYPFEESIRSLLPLVDEFVINVGDSEDGTRKRIETLQQESGSIIQIIDSKWNLTKPQVGGSMLAEQTNIALSKVSGDWCIYLQADEVIHELDHAAIQNAIRIADLDPTIDGLLFDYIHFYGSFDVIQESRSAYRAEVRAFKNHRGIQSVGDAQSFRRKDGSKPAVVRAGARIFHYGWVRTPEAMREKTFFMDQLYHGDPTRDQKQSLTPHTGENYRYKRFWGLKLYRGSHPLVMKSRIAAKNWHWDFQNSKLIFKFSDLKKIFLDTIEKFTGKRLFEFRSYQLTSPQNLKSKDPLATVILATYNMPKELDWVLTALENQTHRNFEILICDDGSDERTAQVIQSHVTRNLVPIQHLWQENRGFRKARLLNRAIALAKGNVLIFLDGDCVPDPHFVQDHLDNQEGGRYLAGRRVEVGQSLSERLTSIPPEQRSGRISKFSVFLDSLFGQTQHAQRVFRVRATWLRKLLKMQKVDDLKGCNYSVQKSHMLSIGGYNEAYEGYGREDTDVEVRLQQLGLKIKSLKGLALQHHLWHPRRTFTPKNDQLLEEAKRFSARPTP